MLQVSGGDPCLSLIFSSFVNIQLSRQQTHNYHGAGLRILRPFSVARWGTLLRIYKSRSSSRKTCHFHDRSRSIRRRLCQRHTNGAQIKQGK